MSPLQKIAMGLVVVFGSALVPADPNPSWARYDALPDPLGWALVLLGLHALTRHDDRFATTRWIAWIGAVVSVPVWFPQLNHLLSPSGAWAASLPQLLFCLVLAREIGLAGAQQQPRDGYAAKWGGLLVWGFAVATLLPVVVLGGGVDSLAVPTQAVATLVDIALVWVLFRLHRRTWLGGPGPLEVQPRTADPRRHADRSPDDRRS